MRGVNHPIPAGYPGHPKDACKIGPEVRPLTTLERSLIQTFPANFKWAGSKTDREQMIGNAVPVNLGKFVAQSLLAYINPSPEQVDANCLDGFETWLSEHEGLSERSAASAASRLARANSMVNVDTASSEPMYLAELETVPAFGALSPTVKSQLRSAVRKYFAYCQLKRNG